MPEETPKHSVSVAGIVVDDHGRVLVIKRRDNGHWEPPGGVLELGETFEEGVKREVLEETGVHVEVDRLTGIYKNMRGHIVALVFLCTPVDTRDGPTAEAAKTSWLSLDDVSSVMLPAYACRVQDAFKPVVQVRHHDGVEVIG